MNTKYTTIIGLEVHVELSTNSKMFCGCPAEHFGVEPNTHTCPVCLGLPGALPVPNKKAIDWTIMLGLAVGCKVNLDSKFDRKNYFYPDLPKGYQITQYDEPFCENGKLDNIRIRRVHLEEDTGKLQHAKFQGKMGTLVDFNRSGVPLVEIVSEPDFREISEVDEYLKNLQKIIRYLGISNADMEKGSMRLEPSISLSLDGSLPKYRVELKNINSFRYARRALEYEIKRQAAILDKGEIPGQQTRGWDDVKGITYSQRGKEEAHDYRYFPEPDIPPIRLTEKQVSAVKKEIPELPDEKKKRFVSQYKLTDYAAGLLTDDKKTADFFETGAKIKSEMAVDLANWIINKKPDLDTEVPAAFLEKIAKSKVSVAVDEKELEKVISEVISQNSKAVADYKAGKTQVFGFLIGQVLRKIKADRKQVEKLLLSRL